MKAIVLLPDGCPKESRTTERTNRLLLTTDAEVISTKGENLKERGMKG